MTSSGVHTVDGVPVWYTHTEGAPGAPRVVFLHGGLSDTRVFEGMTRALEDRFDLWAYDRRAHGRTPDTDEPLGFDSMAAEAVAMIEELIQPPVHLVGHSDGASLALLLATVRPDLVASVSAFSGNLHPAGMMPGEITVAELADAVRDDYAALSPDAIEHLPEVAAKIIRLWFTEPTMTEAHIAAISCPVLIAAPDNDSIRYEHTLAIHAAIPGARLAIVPGATHMVVEQQPALCAQLVAELITTATGGSGAD